VEEVADEQVDVHPSLEMRIERRDIGRIERLTSYLLDRVNSTSVATARSSDSRRANPSLSSFSERTRVVSHGLSSTGDSTVRVSLR
jgi:hypothetical protein